MGKTDPKLSATACSLIITIMVLELKVPHGEDMATLQAPDLRIENALASRAE